MHTIINYLIQHGFQLAMNTYVNVIHVTVQLQQQLSMYF